MDEQKPSEERTGRGLYDQSKRAIKKRHRVFVKEYVKTGRVGHAAQVAGMHPVYGTTLLKRPEILNAIEKALQEAEITDELVAKRIREGLDARYPRKFSPKGEIIQDRDEDYFVRGQYVDRVLKIRGQLAPERVETTEKKIVLVITPELVKGLVDSEALTAEEAVAARLEAAGRLLPSSERYAEETSEEDDSAIEVEAEEIDEDRRDYPDSRLPTVSGSGDREDEGSSEYVPREASVAESRESGTPRKRPRQAKTRRKGGRICRHGV